jgi:excisionase family DNA binding protein
MTILLELHRPSDITLRWYVLHMSHDRQYRSKQLADILGVSLRTLYRMLVDGRIPEPAMRELNGYRTWSAEEVQEIQTVFKGANK